MAEHWTDKFAQVGKILYCENDGLIIQGDNREVVRSFLKASVDLVINDPPWRYAQHQVERISPDQQYHTMSDYEILKFLIVCSSILKNNRHFYVWGTSPRRLEQDRIAMVLTAFTELEYKSELIWDKRPFMGMGNYFRNQIETALLFVKGSMTARRKNIGNIQQGTTAGHSHKPIAVLEAILQLSTRRGQIVLDPFLNTGRTAVVAKSMGRRFVGIEIVPAFTEAAKINVSQEILFTKGTTK